MFIIFVVSSVISSCNYYWAINKFMEIDSLIDL